MYLKYVVIYLKPVLPKRFCKINNCLKFTSDSKIAKCDIKQASCDKFPAIYFYHQSEIFLCRLFFDLSKESRLDFSKFR